MALQNKLVLIIANKTIEYFKSIEVNFDIKAITSNIIIELPYGEGYEDIYKPFEFQSVSLEYNNNTVFLGIIENWQTVINENTCILQGRALTSVFCHKFTNIKNYIYKDTTIGNILNTISGEYNIKVKLPLGDTDKLNTIYFNHNESFACQIQNQISRTSIKGYVPLLSCDFEGNLVFGKNIEKLTEANEVLNLDYDYNNIYDAKINYRGDLRKAKYTRYGQNEESTNIEFTISDSEMSRLNIIDSRYSIGKTIDELRNIASRDRAYDIMASNQIYIHYKSWLDKNNSLIDTGDIVSLRISKKLIKESKKFIIETLKLYYSDDIGFYSMFKLTPDNTFITG